MSVHELPMTELGLWDGYGVEIEYMLVHADTLDVLPVSDAVLTAAHGSLVSETEQGELAWSNELVLHVIELKTNGPAAALEPLPALFQRDVGRIHELLEPLGGRLLPGGMHPWMDPLRETRLWPHEYSEVYETFDRIFGCTGHGWSNLQSTHLNLPFRGDDEFRRLHSAIRLVLPLLPALTAASPMKEGRLTGLLDTRLAEYRHNARRVPSVSGRVVPERMRTRAQYESELLGGIYRDLAPHDPKGVLANEWVNARGAIARFDRGAIEIRVIDTQEHPGADLALLGLVVHALRELVEQRITGLDEQERWHEAELERQLVACVEDGDRAPVVLEGFASVWGSDATTAGGVWRDVAERLPTDSPWRTHVEVVLEEGPLARRLARALRTESALVVHRRLADCLAEGRAFR